jgi:serine kinase of HPr protein (carbohydrate metabolism regulator)
MILHAGLIAAFGSAGWQGVLLEGASGAGKSDLALRAMDRGFRLVADDRTIIWCSERKLYGRAPKVLHGLIEIRGLDVVEVPAVDFCRIALIARCDIGGPGVDRIPESSWAEYLGVRVPTIQLPALEASGPVKLHHALHHLGAGTEGRYQARRVAGELQRRDGESR